MADSNVFNLDAADLHTAVPDTCQMMVASQRFHRDVSSCQMDTSCLGFQDLDTLPVVASCVAVLDDLHHLHTKPVLYTTHTMM